MAKRKIRTRRRARKRRVPPPPTYVLGKGGPSLLDLRLRRSEVRILVTGPGMLYEKLRLVTSLSVSEGCHYRSMQRLASDLVATALCGAQGSRPAEIRVVGRRTSAVLEIEPGPSSMYQNELVLRTRNGWSFDRVIGRALAAGYEKKDYIVALEPIPATGHLEHHAVPGLSGEGDPHQGHGRGGRHHG